MSLMTPSAAATLDIDALRAFLAIADRGGVTAAAERVARTPAAVSMQLKKLEETVGRPLFERMPRRMVLTRDGERLMGYARKMIGLHGDALASFRTPELSGEVRVGVVDDFGVVRLAEALAGFAKTHPDVTVTVSMGMTSRLYKKLDAGELDFSLLRPGCATGWREEDRTAHEEDLVWVGAEGGQAHLQNPLPVALATQGCAWRRIAVDALSAMERPFRIAYSAEFNAAQIAAAAADLAIAPLPTSALRPDLQVLGPKQGLPKLGRTRIALRWGPDAPTPAAEALADRVLGAFALS